MKDRKFLGINIPTDIFGLFRRNNAYLPTGLYSQGGGNICIEWVVFPPRGF
jgi:hypothetical protein